MSRYWQVTLLSPPYQTLTYGYPEYFPALEPGTRVIVPLGRGNRVGVLAQAADSAPEGVEVRPVLWPLETAPVLGPGYMEMVRNLATRQMVPDGRILETLLPRGLRSAAVTYTLERDPRTSPFPASIKPSLLASMPEQDKRVLMEAWLAGKMRVRLNPRKEAEERFVTLAVDPPWPVRPNAKRQLRLLEHLLDNGPQSLFSLKCVLGDWSSDIAQRLEGSGLVTIGELSADMLAQVDEPVDCEPSAALDFDFTGEQELAFASLEAALQEGRPASHLVHGVTGSGKTYLYLNLIAKCLEAGRSALLLAPEVALACQLAKAAARAFPGRNVRFYHGYQSPKKRETTFLEVASDLEPSLVVGTRSSLFLPVKNLGLIILDEEHDESYKQEERLAYQAKEVAWFRVQQANGLLVLGSATPDVKTFHAARSGAVPVSTLAQRVGESELPDVELVDISETVDREQPFAPRSIEAIQETVGRGEQVIVMLNRRGYAPLMYCVDCGTVVRCPECEVGMTFHKGRERVICHYCGLSHAYPLLCAKCGGGNFIPMGEGTERLEEQLQAILPEGTKVLRMDRDSTRRQERMEEILESFRKKEAQVLVGTQMLSKGHHFPDVTLVVVADGDLGLNLPDYRASERTFQLLVQVAGRAGRGGRKGRVLIQTRNPGHEIWMQVLSGDYLTFFNQEIERRRKFGYPPFSKLGLVRISFPGDWEGGQAAMMELGSLVRRKAVQLGVTALGPAPAPLAMLRGRRRFSCLLKSSQWQGIRELYSFIEKRNPAPRKIRMNLDLDPLSML
ncbi:replication restart helicase PriA [Salidesulfovibrio onnuriiensis]|uniref:replication restart helicase PriA n=1 Tax=Salidesulfovibrio onnuriiensis TaxID=2583823 RepID=UPI0011C9A78B|nr:primosomal protein N' [Salidesulfovibrio onnuriiensis]